VPTALVASIGVRPLTGPDGTGHVYLIKVMGDWIKRVYYFSHDEWFKNSILGRLQTSNLVCRVVLPYCLVPINTGRRHIPTRFEMVSGLGGVVIANVGETIAEIFDITGCLSQYPECELRPR